MANFALTNSTNWTAQVALGSTYSALVAVGASSGSFANAPATTGSRRGKIYDILIGTNGTPADNFVEFSLNRATLGSSPVWTGSVSSVSSQLALDQADVSFSAFATVNTSANSSTAFVLNYQSWYVGINQRASYRWVAAPGSEMVWPAVSSTSSNNGFLLSARSAAYTGTATATVLFQEQ